MSRMRDSRGQTNVEWLGVIVLVVLLVGAVAAVANGPARAVARTATCFVQRVGGGDGKCGAGATTPAPVPEGCGAEASYADGPPIAHAGADTDWVPQGLGHDPSDGSLYTTYYWSPDGNPDRSAGVLLSVQDPGSGAETGSALLTGPNGGPDHAGGVAVDGDHVYVASSDGRVYLYSRRDIAAAGGGPVEPVDTFDVPASAYLTFSDGQLYVGSFEKDDNGRLYSIPMGADGHPSGDPVDLGETPERSQGLAVTPTSFIFSTSYGRDEKSTLVAVPRDGSGEPHEITAPNMSEGVVVVDGKLYTVYESGAQAYESDDDDAMPRDAISVTPLGSVDPSIC